MACCVVRQLEKVIASEREDKGFGSFSSEPLVTCNPQKSHPLFAKPMLASSGPCCKIHVAVLGIFVYAAVFTRHDR